MTKSRRHLDLIVAVGFSFFCHRLFLCSQVPDWQNSAGQLPHAEIFAAFYGRRSFAIFPVYDGFLLATLGEGLIFRAHRNRISVCEASVICGGGVRAH
jgi:hypothetical protein